MNSDSTDTNILTTTRPLLLNCAFVTNIEVCLYKKYNINPIFYFEELFKLTGLVHGCPESRPTCVTLQIWPLYVGQ